jgi:hypothetical protein
MLVQRNNYGTCKREFESRLTQHQSSEHTAQVVLLNRMASSKQ